MLAPLAAVAFLCAAYCLHKGVQAIRRAWPLLYVSATAGTHDKAEAIPRFIELLNEARESMIIYDDGRDVDEPIYGSKAVIDAVEEKLKDPSFKFKCFFSHDRRSRFVQHFEAPPRGGTEAPPRVEIETVQPLRHPGETCWKIIDGGKKIYLSRNSPGGIHRYRLIDCTQVPEQALGRAMDAVFSDCEDCKAVLDSDFRSAAPAPLYPRQSGHGPLLPLSIVTLLRQQPALPASLVLLFSLIVLWGGTNLAVDHLVRSDAHLPAPVSLGPTADSSAAREESLSSSHYPNRQPIPDVFAAAPYRPTFPSVIVEEVDREVLLSAKKPSIDALTLRLAILEANQVARQLCVSGEFNEDEVRGPEPRILPKDYISCFVQQVNDFRKPAKPTQRAMALLAPDE